MRDCIFPGKQRHRGTTPRYYSNSISQCSAGIRLVGGVTGFAAINGHVSDVVVRYPVANTGQLGGTEMTKALFMGNTGGVDMDQATVTWMSNGISENLRKTDKTPVVCPNWTIAGKFNMLSMQHADADNILEPNEQFELFICSSNNSAPNQKFTFVIDSAGNALPLSVTRDAPALIRPIMQLG